MSNYGNSMFRARSMCDCHCVREAAASKCAFADEEIALPQRRNPEPRTLQIKLSVADVALVPGKASLTTFSLLCRRTLVPGSSATYHNWLQASNAEAEMKWDAAAKMGGFAPMP